MTSIHEGSNFLKQQFQVPLRANQLLLEKSAPTPPGTETNSPDFERQ
jgi:hypothetical protein